ncbi:hypothetical protein DYB28_003935 [Aphanomyces astaci]|uniref:Uncharacterized protein n=1 Tax=Aphanomyces astaci TaxID=112090 RepID=A0A9X8H426_APHAT|nr:hypothetical protein DYB28_003935 [Aphanomyces astaci]
MTPTPPPPSMPATIASPDVIIIDPSANDVVIPEVTTTPFPGTVNQPRATTPSHVSTASTESGGSNTVGWVMTVAAIVVGIGLLLGAVWLVRRRQQEEDDYDDFDDSFSEKDAQSHPSTTDDDSRPAANVPGAVEASAAQVEKDSMFFTWRSPSRKSQMPVVTALMPTCEDEDDVAPIVARCPSDELTLQNEVPDIFLTGESSSSFASYQYTQRGNQGTDRRPAPHFDARTKDSDHDLSYSRSPPRHSLNHSVMENDDNDSYAGNYNNSMSFRSAASSNASGLYIQSESDYSPRSVQDSSATDRLSNYQL